MLKEESPTIETFNITLYEVYRKVTESYLNTHEKKSEHDKNVEEIVKKEKNAKRKRK